MTKLQRLITAPGRAVTVLSFTQILTWGILIYPPVLTLRHVAAAHDWSLAFCMSGFSLGLVASGILSPIVGGLIDRHGGNVVMSVGALVGAVGLALFPIADSRMAYLGCWLLIGASMAASLYDPAFATLTRIFGSTARRQITFVTFAGGFASTVGWPASHLLLESLGWQGTYLVFAGIFAFVIAPLHGFAIPRVVAAPLVPAASSPELSLPALALPTGWPFILLAAAFSLYSLILSGVTSNLLAMLERGGIDAATAVMIGTLFGPAQVAARLADFLLAGRTSPLWVARGAVALVVAAFAMLAFAGISFAGAVLFAVGFGAANGVITIARGALPLLMFGPLGYGRVIGRIARPALFVQALAPFVVAWSVEQFSDRAVLAAGTIGALVVLSCFMAIRAPAAAAKV